MLAANTTSLAGAALTIRHAWWRSAWGRPHWASEPTLRADMLCAAPSVLWLFARGLIAIALVATGCGDDAETLPVEATPCPPGETAVPDGSCIRPGVPADGCGVGFAHDGDGGCDPLLPPDRCPGGSMALPGDAICRPVMACGAGTWGDIPAELDTVYVDAAYGGGGSDGSTQRPWTAIAPALATAAPGALVALARGSYVGSVLISGKAVRIWGVCPDAVEIVGVGAAPSCPPGAVCIGGAGASGTEIHGVAIRGDSSAVTMSGARDVVLDRVWVHDVGWDAIDVESAIGSTSATVRASLVEHGSSAGVLVGGAEITIEDSVVRGPLATAAGTGVVIQACPAATCGSLMGALGSVRRSVIEEGESGVVVVGSDVSIDSSLVRSTRAPATSTAGRGITAQACTTSQCGGFARSVLTLVASVVDGTSDAGVLVGGSDATIDGSVVRGTKPAPLDMLYGTGITLQAMCAIAGSTVTCLDRTTAAIHGSLFADNHTTGMFITGSDATLESVIVRGTLPQAADRQFGVSANVQVACHSAMGVTGCDPAARAVMSARESLFDGSHDVGLLVWGSDAVLARSVVRAVLPRASDGLYGDGIAVQIYSDPSALAAASATLTGSLITNTARSGVGSFGATTTLATTTVECAAFPLEGERLADQDFVLIDQGGNRCGCPVSDEPCRASSVGLAPPEPLAN